MDILFVAYGVGLSGGNRAIFKVANGLGDRGYRVEILALGGDHSWFDVKVSVKYLEPPKPLMPLLGLYSLIRHGRLKRDAFAVDGLARRLGFRADLIRFLADNIPSDFDVAIATYYPTALPLWLSRHGGAKLYFMQDFPELASLDGDYGLKLFDLTLRLPFDVFLANSGYTKDLVLERQPGARVFVTGVGVDTNVFMPRREDIVDVKDKYKVMVILKREGFKGSDVAVRVLNEVSRKLPIHALIVGEKAFVGTLLKSLGVNFTYTVFSRAPDDLLARIYNSADAFLFTSYAESFGLPPLEAMASGIPVVTTDCLGNRDYTAHGHNALVCKPGDVECLVNSTIRVLKDDKLREELIKNGIETAKQWTWDKVVDKFEEAIKGVVK